MSKIPEKKAKQDSILGVFLLDTITVKVKLYFEWKISPKDRHNQVLYYPKIRALFSILKKGQGAPSPTPLHSCTTMTVAEFASISLNIPKYPWKCFNKLFWLCHSSEYAWSCYMFDWLLKMPQVLNVPGFWIWDCCVCKSHTWFWICLNMAQYASIMLEYALI